MLRIHSTALKHHTPLFRSNTGWDTKGRCVKFRRVTVVIASGKRPVPFRTRKLSLTAPMVLQSKDCGRVGHRRTKIEEIPEKPGTPVEDYSSQGAGLFCVRGQCLGETFGLL